MKYQFLLLKKGKYKLSYIRMAKDLIISNLFEDMEEKNILDTLSEVKMIQFWRRMWPILFIFNKWIPFNSAVTVRQLCSIEIEYGKLSAQ